MLVKYFLIAIVILIVARIFFRWRQKSISVVEFIFWLCFWAAACVAIIRPETTTFVAHLIGIGRGADMVVYLAVILIFYIIFQMTVRLEKMERNITKVVRELAIQKHLEDDILEKASNKQQPADKN